MEKAKQVLDTLNVPHPTLAPFDPASISKIPYEDKIRETYIETDKLRSSTQEAKNQADFEMTKFVWAQVGTLAFFGVHDDNLIEQMAYKFSSLSYIPTPIRISRMGEDVPEPTAFQIDIERQRFENIDFTFEELKTLDKTFAIVYLESFNSAGEKVYAYVNVRFDRFGKLFSEGETDKPFNLPDYATILSTGQGQPTQEVREKLKRDYLFGEHSLNVRIFPPLSEVT
jgi:hypothetical protein